MFSTLLRSSAAFFFPYDGSEELVSRSQPGQQIQAELEQAAEQGMVSTRSHDNTPVGGGSHPSNQLYPQVVVFEKKRKFNDRPEESPAQVVTKKRRRSAKSNGDAAPSSSAGKPGRPRKRAHAKIEDGHATNPLNHSESDQDPSTQGSRPASPRMPGTTTDQNIDDREQKKAIESAPLKKPNQILSLDDEVLEAYDQAKPDASSATTSRKGKTAKKRMRDLEGSTSVDGNGANVGASEKKPDVLFATAAKATHTRFGSEDIEAPGTITSTSIEERQKIQEGLSENESESESGDEAPETVTASAGFDKSRTAALEAAKIAARQEAGKKRKRREHDERLRLQAKIKKNSRSKDKPPTKSQETKTSFVEAVEADGQMHVVEPESLGESPQAIDEDRNPSAKTKFPRKTPLPLLLPEEILAANPAAHAPIPPFSNSKLATSQKRKFVHLEPKPPKDIKRGNVNVRVLQDNRSILPPKSSHASKALRESWLIGRRGTKGEIGVPRRKPSGGFVRNKQ